MRKFRSNVAYKLDFVDDRKSIQSSQSRAI
nr:MAG TPA: hypothetical protein [Caudoviricetes sp.]DAV28050.1 MAG TPA: hypothetical protein [Caudoviricetes sp.]DAY96164.1 MAG TPA: hypothetical protein [Caudoviricetes sp.]